MITTFKSRIVKGNNIGAGFIRLPVEIRLQFKENDQYKVKIMTQAKPLDFFGNIRDYDGIGFYIPANLTRGKNLFGISSDVEITKIEGFHNIAGNDGRVYIPSSLGKKLGLKHDTIVLVECHIGEKLIKKFSLVKIREHDNKESEYLVMIGPENKGLEGIFNINIISKNKENIKIPAIMDYLLHGFNYCPINADETVVFHNSKRSVIINNNLNPRQIAYYLGAYFADGTRKGNSWAISASTFEQAKYYLTQHNSILKQPLLKFALTYTTNQVLDETDKFKLIKNWRHETGVIIDNKRVRIILTDTKNSANRNKYGSLTIKENKQLVLQFYNRLLNYLLHEIKVNNDKQLALEFICGILEGDGSASARARGHIHIATNKTDIKILNSIFAVAGLKCKGYLEGENKGTLRIGSLEIIKNLDHLPKKLFEYYPKRRRKLIERLLQTGAARYIIGKQDNTSAWVKIELRNAGIFDNSYNLTNKGNNIKKYLVDMEKELN